ncbi:MFS transporter [Deinococcus sp. Marseille-Q6407]|uniref:MFS transporter n=1 Tax=Deinococcus sp. Marseille-Q6407 TaxID=2969223 RepID=UPI0021C1FD25|nr:MFS transporter [Deinococcus sp. Marseille-Q6407]
MSSTLSSEPAAVIPDASEPRRRNIAAWAVTAACLIAFMGVGVVDPILPEIGKQLGATPPQVELLFTTYLGVMAVMTLFAGNISTRFGRRRVALVGLALIALFAAACGLSGSIPALAVFRGGWGLGNALFTPTALVLLLALIGHAEKAIMRYEAAIGLGMSMGPLLGGLLGAHSWRFPFFGAATLMLLALASVAALVKVPESKDPVRPISDVFRAYSRPAFLAVGVTGLLYYFGFFLLLGYTPLFLHLSTLNLGLTFFGWGILLGLGSTKLAEVLLRNAKASHVVMGSLAGLTLIFLLLGFAPVASGVKVGLVVLSGVLFGLMNATMTTLSVEVSHMPRPTATSAYNFLRWLGAAAAPVGSGLIAERMGAPVPYAFGAGAVVLGLLITAVAARQIDAARATDPHVH